MALLLPPLDEHESAIDQLDGRATIDDLLAIEPDAALLQRAARVAFGRTNACRHQKGDNRFAVLQFLRADLGLGNDAT